MKLFFKWYVITIILASASAILLIIFLLKFIRNYISLKASEERYRFALDGINDFIWEINVKNSGFFISDKWYQIAGLNPKEKITLEYFIDNYVHPEDFSNVVSSFNEYINSNGNYFKCEFRMKFKNGSYIWVYCRGKALRNINGKTIKVSGSITDISDRKAAEEKINYMAFYDTLTGLPNKKLLIKMLNERILSSKASHSEGIVLFIDIDNFKNINDIMGHDFGDKVLIEFSKKLSSIIDKEDILGRFGGDKFIIIHPLTDKENITNYGLKTANLFTNMLDIDHKQLYANPKIGISVYPKDGESANIILKNSDTAMYQAKENSKTKLSVYSEDMHIKLERRTCIERILKSSIANSELSVYYQPQFTPLTNKISGFEALLRLNSKELGPISPDEFIPIAEETGDIIEIGTWVLKESCKKCVEWKSRGFNFDRLSVNISSVQLREANFTDTIMNTLKETGASPNDIELEITETVLMKSLDYNVVVIENLLNMGIRIALDDFGTGYSSLNYLRKIPISTLKIDKSFIDNISSSIKEKAIIGSIIQMAHNINLKVIAEGVEAEEQLYILKSMKCDDIQGYFYSKPLTPKEVEKLFAC